MAVRRRWLLALLIFCMKYQDSLSAKPYVEIKPSYVIVNPGGNVTFDCKLIIDGQVFKGPLDSCSYKFEDGSYSIKPGRGMKGLISYVGKSLEAGDCGATLYNIRENRNGNMTCGLTMDTNDASEYVNTVQIVVAIRPSKPELEVSVASKGDSNSKSYREMDQLTATCTVRDGRPAANITWYMGMDRIKEGLQMPVETCTPQKRQLCTIQQNLTRVLQASDDKKTLKCVASHFALNGEDMVVEDLIKVNYSPKPSPKPLEHFELRIGSNERIVVTIEANPKPLVSWTVGGDTILENTQFDRYKVEATLMKGPGQYETALQINSLTKEDTAKVYQVTAHNDLGEQSYSVSLSTGPEPKVLEMGAGLIIIIVTAVLVILLILGGVLYVRAKGKFCFSVNAEKRVVSPSEGTENPVVNHHASSEYIDSGPELKKEKKREDTTV